MKIFKGLIFIKYGRVGTRSEGPDYNLQTENEDFLLNYQERNLWEPDYHLEFYCRRMVEVSGEIESESEEIKVIRVESINEIADKLIPPVEQTMEQTNSS